jgi:hypothetical protein
MAAAALQALEESVTKSEADVRKSCEAHIRCTRATAETMKKLLSLVTDDLSGASVHVDSDQAIVRWSANKARPTILKYRPDLRQFEVFTEAYDGGMYSDERYNLAYVKYKYDSDALLPYLLDVVRQQIADAKK